MINAFGMTIPNKPTITGTAIIAVIAASMMPIASPNPENKIRNRKPITSKTIPIPKKNIRAMRTSNSMKTPIK